MSVLIDLVGQRFGRLIVLSRDPEGTGRKVRWNCRCDCGVLTSVSGNNLRAGKTQSCGCLQRELAAERQRTHGATERGNHWPEWGVYCQMLNRCYRPETDSYRNYGGRGIQVCDRWRFGEDGKSGFECFIDDMGRRPASGLSIDRFPDNDGNYEPGNCRWATASQQQLNARTAVRLEFGGREMAASEWADELGMPVKALYHRISRGWTVERALTQPLRGSHA